MKTDRCVTFPENINLPLLLVHRFVITTLHTRHTCFSLPRISLYFRGSAILPTTSILHFRIIMVWFLRWLTGYFWPILPDHWVDDPPQANPYGLDLLMSMEMTSSAVPSYYNRYGEPVYNTPDGSPPPLGEGSSSTVTISTPILPLQNRTPPHQPWPEEGCDPMSWAMVWVASFFLDGVLIAIICLGTVKGGFLWAPFHVLISRNKG
ncbi:hypothetical protein BZA05DRAFT_445641 [Tricharina praecox]|uniref:uncharacterized protein n=1 Tax=Tricharina praecox TaxID=43433 RepID=UPI002220B2AB|nr:uncharacterized protein BZA05DRAFT_445641 [Tricharina praecox]KAI5850801.1 hypothetical protein BZA05DRAFT_445641 [Tricharina praecox]